MEPVKISTEGFLDPIVAVGAFGVGSGMRVADFGCGAGHITVLVAQRAGPDGKVTALDIMEDKLDSVRARAKAAGLDNIDTVRANLELTGSSGLSDGSQNIVILATILFQSQKKADIIKESARVLKPDGKIILVEWKKGTGSLGPPDELRTPETEMRELFRQAGFSNSRQFSAGRFHYGYIFTR
ncbi:MAG: hypothetical protein A2941_01910 [Candidatus Yanofskybacteria bacterium RIFCSPLOWO2_01_FULL_49_17]|uniref:Methyltransferase domain-containing protein n=1 Tax=Candidatus Yanofskybacteria bacterium RIFCSPLOWO2_01_FULL_49_17 TaxID=1802700 RepID=A0A1F8GSL8_9BACT|nr:MAG: hypothetical protein A2941_01910 [Candidatus Yanofskybacteria bacterium RIFCSPLOWO2_01_FULL_49_17]